MSRPWRPTSSSPSDCSGGVFDWDVALRKLDELNARVEDPTLWDNPDEAQAVSRDRSRLEGQVNAVKEMEQGLEDGVMLAEMADEEGDEAALEDARAQLKAIKDRAARAELEALLSGEADGRCSGVVRRVEGGDKEARGRAVDPVTVAAVVVAVVERRRGLRHPVGWSARARCAARGVVPAGLQRRLLGRLTGQEPGKPSPRHADGVILVTGCSTGFGLQIAVELARRGRRVAATMRDLDRRGRLDAVLADAEVADRVEVLAMDVTDPGSVYDVFLQVDRWEAVAGERGRLIGVVNNAGIRAVGAFEDIPPAVVDRVLETNLYGTLTVSRAAIPRLRTHGGRIVCVTSSSALAGLPAWSAYAASKWGVEGWAESMAFETTPHGIDMVLVEPGAYPTDILRDGTTFGTDDSPYVLMNEAMAEADRQAAERGGDPADVARVVARAFDARSTLIRRPVGRGAWLRWAARGVVPFGVQRWATERMLGLR